MRIDYRLVLCSLVAGLITAASPGCGGDEPVAQQRGAPVVAGGGADGAPPPAGGPAPVAGPPLANGEDGPPSPRPDRPKIILTREDFGPETRDPFESFIDLALAPQSADSGPILAPRQREVRLAEYSFEDLKLIGIVMSGRGVQPRALFVSTDGKSKTVRQGEYFSRAEVLLANVNRDYVEIEVVDEELAKGLNLTAGETRAIYLKND